MASGPLIAVWLALLLCCCAPAHGQQATGAEQIHLSVSSDEGSLTVSFVSFIPGLKPCVRYGLASGKYAFGNATVAWSAGYRQGGWPGMLYQIELTSLLPDTFYYYLIASTADLSPLSAEYSFRTYPTARLFDPVQVAVAADMGSSPEAQATAASLTRLALGGGGGGGTAPPPLDADLPTQLHALVMAGDLAYAAAGPGAEPYEALNDQWANLLQPVTARVPLLTAPGEHEQYDYDLVPYTLRYAASQPNGSASSGIYWYSVDLGPLHLVSLSTIHPYGPGSPQRTWLEADLAAAQARKAAGAQSYSVTVAHQPMYSSALDPAPAPAAAQLRAELEPLFNDRGVDLALWGHAHVWERSFPLQRGQVVATASGSAADPYICPNGTIHVVVGSAGAPFPSELAQPQPAWSAYRAVVNGYALLVVHQNGTLHVQCVAAGPGSGSLPPCDDLWVHKPEEGTDAAPVLLIATLASLAIVLLAIGAVLALTRGLGDPGQPKYASLGAQEGGGDAAGPEEAGEELKELGQPETPTETETEERGTAPAGKRTEPAAV